MGRGPKWKKDEIAVLIQLKEQGLTFQQISEEFEARGLTRRKQGAISSFHHRMINAGPEKAGEDDDEDEVEDDDEDEVEDDDDLDFTLPCAPLPHMHTQTFHHPLPLAHRLPLSLTLARTLTACALCPLYSSSAPPPRRSACGECISRWTCGLLAG